ncbi:MAG: porin [Deltaproteobacteria bacterium]|nr:porin [Deltaproteobacteria bacterium]
MRKLWVMGVMLAVITAGQGFAAEAEEEMRLLRRQMAEQQKTMKVLEKRMHALEGKLEAKGKEDGFEAKDIYDNGFYIRSKDKRFSLVMNGFTQFRYTLSEPEKGSTSQTFDVALARLALSGNVFDPKIGYFLQLQGSTFGDTNGVTMLDWWMQYRFSPDLNVLGGRFILPYSRQFYTHPGNLLFTDLSEADFAFNLPRTIGAQLAGKVGRVAYHVAVANSIRALDSGGQQNFGEEIAVLGRLEWDILDPYGYLETSPKPANSPQLSVGVAAAFNPIDGASTFQNVLPDDRTTNVTVDAGFRWKRLSLQAAGHYRNNHHGTPGMSDSDDWGYYAQIGYYLIPEKLELGGRISGVDFDQPNAPKVLGDTTEYTLGFNYYLYGHNVKLQTDYSFLDRDPFTGSRRGDHRFRVQTQILF